jgi:hypothetical protein
MVDRSASKDSRYSAREIEVLIGFEGVESRSRERGDDKQTNQSLSIIDSARKAA